MLTKKQLKIIEVFRKNPEKKLTFNQIKERANLKSNNFLQLTLSKCQEEKIIITETVGKTLLYSLELNNKTYSYFSLINYELYDLPIALLKKIEKETLDVTEYFTLAIFGSFTKKENTKSSDLDIAIIIENSKYKNKISSNLESLKRKEFKTIDYHIFTKKEFMEMLRTKEENLGKEIKRNNLIFTNPSIFYEIK